MGFADAKDGEHVRRSTARRGDGVLSLSKLEVRLELVVQALADVLAVLGTDRHLSVRQGKEARCRPRRHWRSRRDVDFVLKALGVFRKGCAARGEVAADFPGKSCACGRTQFGLT
jgi:hypothetical protein